LKAFTLTEILVVLLIIGILVLLALPNLMPLITKAKSTEAKLQLQHVYTLEKSYFYEKSRRAAATGGSGACIGECREDGRRYVCAQCGLSRSLPGGGYCSGNSLSDRKASGLPGVGIGGLSGAAGAGGGGTPAPAMESVTSILQLSGIIANPQKRSRVAIITLRGKEYLVREKEKIEGITIKKIERDRIRILYKGELVTIGK